MSSDMPAVTPPQPKRPIPWLSIIAVLAAYFFGAGKNPLDLIAPKPTPPEVVEPAPTEPGPVTPGPVEPQPTPDEPLVPVPDTPPVVEPDPDTQPPPKQLDETAAIARYAAELLPKHVHRDIPKIAAAAAGCADRIDAGSIRKEEHANAWLSIENYHAASDFEAWRPFFRAMQSRFGDLQTVGKMATLADWSREFRSMSDGLAAASVSKSLNMEPSTDE